MVKSIVHLSYSAGVGGAGRAAYRIHAALSQIILNSSFYAVRIGVRDRSISLLYKNKAMLFRHQSVKFLLRCLSRIISPKDKTIKSYSIVSLGLLRQLYKRKSGVIFLHWIGGELCSISEIERLPGPICVFMHDFWMLSGVGHLPSSEKKSPGRFISGLDYRLKERKRRFLSRPDVFIVSPSRMMHQQVVDGLSLSEELESKARVIAIPLDEVKLSPVDRSQALSYLGLNEQIKGKILLLCLAGQSDPNKGVASLRKAIMGVAEEFTLISFGGTPLSGDELGFPYFHWGYAFDEATLSCLYSAADATLVPSIFESFGQVAAEAQICGCPVLAFDGTGAVDIVENRTTGILVENGDFSDYARNIERILSQPNDSLFLSRAEIRSLAIQKFGRRSTSLKLKNLLEDISNAGFSKA